MKFAVIGSQTKKSLSPKLNNWIYKWIKEKHSYGFIQINNHQLDNVIGDLRKNKLHGINVTTPFKTDLLKYVDSIDELSKNIGAINCIRSINGKLKGYNTDYYGFSKLVKLHNVDFADKSILVLGAGGASKAISIYLRNHVLDFSIYNRTKSNAVDLIRNLEIQNMCNHIESMDELNSFDLVINALPSEENCYNLIISNLSKNVKHQTFIDINYNSHGVYEWSQSNIKYIDGLYMLIFQAIKSNEIWINNNLPLKVDYVKLHNFLMDE